MFCDIVCIERFICYIGLCVNICGVYLCILVGYLSYFMFVCVYVRCWYVLGWVDQVVFGKFVSKVVGDLF